MTTTRREFLNTTLLSAGAVALNASAGTAADASTARPPMRFIFMHKGNGLYPRVMVPPSFDKAAQEREQRKEPCEVDLDGHDLPDWMSPLVAHRNDMTILQGLSGKMCTTGHHSWCSSLGVFKANERVSSIRWATVDFELAKLFPSPLEHVELACFPLDGGNPRGTLDGIAQGFSARGPQQPNFAFGSPKVAVQELFKSVSADKDAQTRYRLQRQILEFVAGNETARSAELTPEFGGGERSKVRNYADAIEAMREQNRKVDGMAEQIRKHVPQLDAKYLADNMTTLDRQRGHTEVLLAALVFGLTNVVAFTVDELGHHYTGLPGLEGEKVNMHDVGHGKTIGGVEADEIRRRCRRHHMTLVDTIVTRLKSVPEGDGTMFDNTMLCYFPDSGETHHSVGTEFPFLVLSGQNTRLDIRRRYIRLPDYGRPGHKTLGNWYTTILNAYGNPISHYGDIDTGLARFPVDQKGPIPAFLRG